jgi:8-oxo-dGTP pyrophosphatase MutT (NUDIX family)
VFRLGGRATEKNLRSDPKFGDPKGVVVWANQRIFKEDLLLCELMRIPRDIADMKSQSSAKNPSRDVAELRQVAAIPLRNKDGRREVCLVTTRETKRWSIPKGWPMKGVKDPDAAALEAEQEAGLFGKISKTAIGTYLYWKRRQHQFDLVRVTVYRLEVMGHLSTWAEQGQREIRWFPIEEAAALVAEPGLIALIAGVEDPLAKV